jgi:hypothetical protein
MHREDRKLAPQGARIEPVREHLRKASFGNALGRRCHA